MRLSDFKSQFGQDKYLFETFLNHKDGFFVDVGAHDGVYLSNTFCFEDKLGWSGICVEPSKESSRRLVLGRKNSKVFNCCASPLELENQLVRYREHTRLEISHTIFEDLYESPNYAKELEMEDNKYWDRLKKCKSLGSILNESNINKKIDYISIDTNGSEFLIIKDFPFEKWNVEVFTIANDAYLGGLKEENRNKTKSLMESNGYILKRSFYLKELDKNNWGKDLKGEIIEDLYVKQDG